MSSVKNTHGLFNYQSAAVPSSLRSTGDVYMDRDVTGSDNEPVGLDQTPTDVPVHDGRFLPLTLDKNGFILTQHAYDHIDYMDEEQIVNKYYTEACQLVKDLTGADKVVAFDHNVRCSEKKSWMNKDGETAPGAQIKGGNVVQSPAAVVHNDYTLTSAPLRLQMLTEPARINDTWKSLVPEGSPLVSPEEMARRMGKRWAMINVWRSISDEPVQDMPLALCDGQTFTKNELVTFEIRYKDRTGENYFVKHSPDHKWIYFPQMIKDEAILLKVWDSEGVAALETSDGSSPPSVTGFSFHSAFKDPAANIDCPHRESIEIRTVVFY